MYWKQCAFLFFIFLKIEPIHAAEKFVTCQETGAFCVEASTKIGLFEPNHNLPFLLLVGTSEGQKLFQVYVGGYPSASQCEGCRVVQFKSKVKLIKKDGVIQEILMGDQAVNKCMSSSRPCYQNTYFHIMLNRSESASNALFKKMRFFYAKERLRVKNLNIEFRMP